MGFYCSIEGTSKSTKRQYFVSPCVRDLATSGYQRPDNTLCHYV
jgi:hypothetical protein